MIELDNWQYICELQIGNFISEQGEELPQPCEVLIGEEWMALPSPEVLSDLIPSTALGFPSSWTQELYLLRPFNLKAKEYCSITYLDRDAHFTAE